MREHEILRLSASLGGHDRVGSCDHARREVLVWAQNRSGGRLPAEAWTLDAFEYLSGGRNSVGVRIKTQGSDIWALRADDPDKTVPGRIWTTEVVVGLMEPQRPQFSARLLVSSTTDDELNIEPHVPGFILQVAERCGLLRGSYDLDAAPLSIESGADAEHLAEMLVDPERALPVFVLSISEDDQSQGPLIDAQALGRATLGIGHVAVVPPQFTWELTDRFGKVRSVFGGAVRAYMPGFNRDAYPYDHRLVLAEQLTTVDARKSCSRWMRMTAAAESVRQNRLGHDVLAFAAIRNASLLIRQRQLSSEGANASVQLVAAEARIVALEKALREEAATQEYFDSEAKKAEERAKSAEAQYRASIYRIQDLQDQIRRNNTDADSAARRPSSWPEFANWCDVYLAGRVALAPAARRGVRSPDFEDIDLVVRCMLWLAGEYRDGRVNGIDRDFRDVVVESGVRNSPCGGDEFDFDWQGRRQTADWHLKKGGNTRDPRRCLRIYYYWDPDTQQVLIADMPGHRASLVS